MAESVRAMRIDHGPEGQSRLGDVVFFHGLGGDATGTWTTSSSAGKGEDQQEIRGYFPAVLGSDFPEVGIWAVDYSAAVTSWSERATYDELERHCSQILEVLTSQGVGRLPTILIGHSLGGIVVKSVLRKSANATFGRQKPLHANTKAVAFIATPHKGSSWADVLTKINRLFGINMASERVSELSVDSTYLESLSSWYRVDTADCHIETVAFFEQRKTHNMMIVPHWSANPDVVGCDPVGVNKNHIDIAKPARKDDTVYQTLSGLIGYHLIGDAGTGVPPQTVVIGVVRKTGKVLMVRRRNPTSNLTWQFVAGRLRVGEETEAECLAREIAEETSVAARIDRPLGVVQDQSVPYKRVYYACTYLDGEPQNADPKENSDVRWVPIERVRDFITTPLADCIAEFLGI